MMRSIFLALAALGVAAITLLVMVGLPDTDPITLSWGQVVLAVLIPVGCSAMLLVSEGTRASGIERELRRERQRLIGVMETVPAPISVQGPDGTFIVVNRALVAHYEAERADQILGHRARSGSIHDTNDAFQQVIATGHPCEVMRYSLSRKGERHIFRSSLVPFEMDNGDTGVLQVATDITETLEVRERLEYALTRALSEHIPMCAGCRQVRLDPGYETSATPEWAPLESYVSARTEAQFSHTFCPDCARTLYGDELPELVDGAPDG